MRYAITDGSANPTSILRTISHWVDTRSVDRLQIREKTLSPKALYDLTQQAIALARPAGIEVLVNERADVALAAGADGVHLPSRAISPATLRKLGVRLIGVSCHNEDELQQAAREGADFAVLAPIFLPLSKTIDTPPLGLERFGRLAKSTNIPVLALGGVTAENTAACLQAGATGVAGITIFGEIAGKGGPARFNASAPRPSTGTAAHPEPRSPRS